MSNATKSTPVDGRTKVLWVPAIAGTIPTLAELAAAGVKDLSCWITADGWNPSLSEDTIDDQRLCDTATFEEPGRYQRSLQVKYVDNPSQGDQSTNNVAYVTLVPGTSGFFVVRRGPLYSAAMVNLDPVQVWPVTMGQYDELAPTANAVFQTQQKAFVTSSRRDGTLPSA